MQSEWNAEEETSNKKHLIENKNSLSAFCEHNFMASKQ